MYPLKQLCKQYTNPSLSEILLQGLSPFLPPLPRSPVLWLDSKQGPQGNPVGGTRSSSHHLALVTRIHVFLQGPDYDGRCCERLSGWDLCLPPVSLISFMVALFFSLSIPKPFALPPPPRPTPVPSFPRDPSHPTHQAIP